MKKKLLILISLIFCSSLFAEKPIIYDIQAFAGNNKKINLIWVNPKNPDQEIKSLNIYRDTKPITDSNQLNSDSFLITITPNSTSYTDTVNDYKDYFYAVIAVTDKPYNIILPSINSLSVGVHLTYHSKQDSIEPAKQKEKLYPDGTIREKPLPYIDYIEGLQEEEVISDKTVEETKKLSSGSSQKNQKLQPYFFEEDLISPDGGDDYLLFDILKNYFVQRNYDEAIIYLERLAGTNISASTRNRTYFYIGECQYLTGYYSQSVKTFVRVEKEYPVLAKKWIDSALDLMIN